MSVPFETRRRLRQALGTQVAADELADLVDTQAAGTLSEDTKRRIRAAFANRVVGDKFITAVEASSAMDDLTQRHAAIALGSDIFAATIETELTA